MKLYHFACSHAAEQIWAAGVLRPWRQVALGGVELVWLTDLDAPTRYEIGLTSYTLNCDRMAHRFEVDCDAIAWVEYARTLPREVRRAARSLNASQGARPMHWYVTTSSVPLLAVAA